MNEIAGDVTARTKAAHRRAALITGSMLSSLVAYTVVVEVMLRSGAASQGVSDVVRWAFYGVAVTMVFSSHLVKGLMLGTSQPAGVDEALARLTTVHTVVAAMAEAPVVLGFVLFFLDHRFHNDFYFLLVISAYLLVRHFPRLGQWEGTVRRIAATS